MGRRTDEARHRNLAILQLAEVVPEASAAHQRLLGLLVDLLADPTARQRMVELGQDIAPRDQQTPEALAALQKAEIEKWWPIIKSAGIKAD